MPDVERGDTRACARRPSSRAGIPMGGLSPLHWILVLLVILLLFGSSRLADIGKGLGEGIRNFKKGLSDDDVRPEKPAEDVKRLAKGEEGKDQDKA